MIPGMMGDDEKKIAMVIVGNPAKEEPADMVGLDVAVHDLMEAIKSGDKKTFKEALRSFISLCEDDDEEGDQGEEEY